MSNELPSELNLMAHRAPSSVWHRHGWNHMPGRSDLSGLLVGAGAAALAVRALRRRSWRNLILAGAGSTVAWWTLGRKGRPAALRRWISGTWDHLSGYRTDADEVSEASRDSFPASDPPAWTPTVGTGRR